MTRLILHAKCLEENGYLPSIYISALSLIFNLFSLVACFHPMRLPVDPLSYKTCPSA